MEGAIVTGSMWARRRWRSDSRLLVVVGSAGGVEMDRTRHCRLGRLVPERHRTLRLLRSEPRGSGDRSVSLMFQHCRDAGYRLMSPWDLMPTKTDIPPVAWCTVLRCVTPLQVFVAAIVGGRAVDSTAARPQHFVVQLCQNYYPYPHQKGTLSRSYVLMAM